MQLKQPDSIVSKITSFMNSLLDPRQHSIRRIPL
jgi:hypothetical protein